MLQAGDIINCQYCGEALEIEEDDLELAISSFGSLVYIKCPCCGKPAYEDGIVNLNF